MAVVGINYPISRKPEKTGLAVFSGFHVLGLHLFNRYLAYCKHRVSFWFSAAGYCSEVH